MTDTPAKCAHMDGTVQCPVNAFKGLPVCIYHHGRTYTMEELRTDVSLHGVYLSDWTAPQKEVPAFNPTVAWQSKTVVVGNHNIWPLLVSMQSDIRLRIMKAAAKRKLQWAVHYPSLLDFHVLPSGWGLRFGYAGTVCKEGVTRPVQFYMCVRSRDHSFQFENMSQYSPVALGKPMVVIEGVPQARPGAAVQYT